VFKVDKDPSKVAIVLLDPVVQLANVGLVEEPQNLFLERATPFAGDDLDEIDFPVDCLLQDTTEFSVDLVAAIVNVM
jgi:hypothetical protein